MAIISIPKSVGSSSIPSGLIAGPLGPLYHDPKSSINFHKYPKDLETASKGHVVQLIIKEQVPITFQDFENQLKKLEDASASALQKLEEAETAKEKAKALGAMALNKAEELFASAKNKVEETFENGVNVGKPIEDKIVAYISLYMPDTMNFTYDTLYDKVSVTNNAAEALGMMGLNNKTKGKNSSKIAKLFGAVSSAVGNIASNKNTIITQAAKNAGYAINPNQSMLFNGIDLREFQLSFVFTPTSAQEAREVEEIVKLIKGHSRPQKYQGGFGMFFKPPARFGVQFLFNGKPNSKIPKVQDCVIQTVDVNYAPNGWVAHTDGAPVQTTLTMRLMETSIVDKTDIIGGGY